MSVRIEMYRVAGRKFLKEYLKSFEMFHYCSGASLCWRCIKKKRILDEFEKKRFNSFNKSVDCWSVIECDLYDFEMFPIVRC